MSSKRGETTRKRPQKYQNTRAYKNDLHDKTPQTKFINSIQISNVCERCKGILEWKIKYKKFKPMKFPSTCVKCLEKCVKHAYHTMCSPCANKLGVCPKCGKAEELVQPVPTAEERLKLDLEMQAMLKSLPERKRRTFLRFLEKGKKKARKDRKKSEDDANAKSDEQDTLPREDGEEDDTKKTTHDLMAFLQRLKLSCKDGDDMDDFDDFGDSDDSFEDSENEEDGDGDDDEDDSDDDDDEIEGKGGVTKK
ncbi:uncharacterized protein C9orf85 homolog [Thrips palmi]|uniref:Uncharacterized protein C9orf85 homolog n=1 Tax=Thrips palmi TaxID=161013 RepID=A0A6P8ZHD2_THRPL|nr:uncharacterized protein C9orf85 homolog [Thrips palmi]